jgi:hypothetical protein
MRDGSETGEAGSQGGGRTVHPSEKERRSKPRIRAGLAAQLSDEFGDDAVAAETINLSMAGVSCRVLSRVELLTKVRITLLVPEIRSRKKAKTAVVSTEGVVVRCEGVPSDRDTQRYEIACAFTALRDKDRKVLQAYVDARLAEASSAAGSLGSHPAGARGPK